MKRTLLILCILGMRGVSIAQNTFPIPTGNVGVGTTSPALKLQVFNTELSGRIAGFYNDGYLTGHAGYLHIGGSHQHNHYGVEIGYSHEQSQPNVNNSAMVFRTTQLEGTNLTERMRISSGGNVGVGTANPAGKLHVNLLPNQSAYFASTLTAGTQNSLTLGYTEHNGYYEKVKLITHMLDDAARSDFHIAVDNGANSLSADIADSRFMVSGTTGNVGIGTVTPSEKLAVNGKIRAKEVKVEAGPWPDYVFEKGYELEKLERLEGFIKDNKHLPEMPSAKEVEKEGINLGEMDARLLKKIEELTLHVIELNKTVQKQEREIKQLRSKL